MALRMALLAAALTVAAPIISFAATTPLTVSNAWMRVITPQVPAGGYFTLHNAGPAPVTLTGASSPGCGMLMLHRTSESAGMSSMQMVQTVPVPPGGTIRFAPGGYHLMCMQPAPGMRPGGTIPVTLTFADGRTVESSFSVRGATGR